MKKIVEKLFKNQDLKYKEFSSKLIPNISKDTIIGVRTPLLRKIAKEIIKENLVDEFINELPHKYHEENMIHSLLVSTIKDEETLVNELDKFIPYITNWAVSDSISPKVLKNNRDVLYNNLEKWIKSKEVYRVRLSLTLLLEFYLDEEYLEKSNKLALKVKGDDYYIKMAVAWYFSYALIKDFEKTIYVISERKLDKWTHNKTISKCIDSYRITNERKNYLKSLRY